MPVGRRKPSSTTCAPAAVHSCHRSPMRASRLLPPRVQTWTCSRRDVGIGQADGPHHLLARRAEGDEDRLLGGAVGHGLRQEEVAHVALVGAGDGQRLVEQVQDGHRPGLGPLGEARRVFQGVDGRSPDGDAGGLDVAVELFPAVVLAVEQAHHLAVEPAGHRRPGVDAAEAELRVGAHLRGLAGLGHQPLADADHDGVVLGELARQVPQALAHGIGRDGVGLLLGLVEPGLVETLAGAVAAEQARAQRRHGTGDGEQPLHAALHERDVAGELLRRFAAHPGDLDVLEPEVEAAEDGAGVKGPLGDQVPGLLVRSVMATSWANVPIGPRGHFPGNGPVLIVGERQTKIKSMASTAFWVFRPARFRALFAPARHFLYNLFHELAAENTWLVLDARMRVPEKQMVGTVRRSRFALPAGRKKPSAIPQWSQPALAPLWRRFRRQRLEPGRREWESRKTGKPCADIFSELNERGHRIPSVGSFSATAGPASASARPERPSAPTRASSPTSTPRWRSPPPAK